MSKLVPCAPEEATVVRIGATEFPIKDDAYPFAKLEDGDLELFEDPFQEMDITFGSQELSLLQRLGALEFLKPREPKTVTVEGCYNDRGLVECDISAVYKVFDLGDKFTVTFTEILGSADGEQKDG